METNDLMSKLEKIQNSLSTTIENSNQDGIPICYIDKDSRIISVPDSGLILGVESDERANRIRFQCSKIVSNNIDLSTYTIRINYKNANGEVDRLNAENVQVQDDGNTILFDWVPSRRVTLYKGIVNFIVCAVKIENEIIVNEWNTTLAHATVLEGLETTYTESEEDTMRDLLSQMILELNLNAQSKMNEIEQKGKETLNTIPEDYTALNQSVKDFGFSKILPVSTKGGVPADEEMPQILPVYGLNYDCSMSLSDSATYGIMGFELAESYEELLDQKVAVLVKNVGNELCATTIVITNNPVAWGSADGKTMPLQYYTLFLEPNEVTEVEFSVSDYKEKYEKNPSFPKRFCILFTKNRPDDSNVQHLLVCFHNATEFAKYQGFDSSRVNYPLKAVEANKAKFSDESGAAKKSDFASSASPIVYVSEDSYSYRTSPKDTGVPTVSFDVSTGFFNYSKSEDVSCVYTGLYIHVPSDWLEDNLCLDVDAPGSVSEFYVLNGIVDWGSSPGGVFFASNDKKNFSLKQLISDNPSYYANKDSIYITALRYASAGVSDPIQISARLSNISRETHVLANEITDALKTEIVEAAKAALAPPKKYITCWGDSLTAQGGWTTKLQELSGMPVYNGGTGGETCRTIMARQGGDIMMVDGVQIPAGKTPVLLASRNSDKGIITWFGNHSTPLLQGGSAHVNPCKIGDVVGTLTWTGSGYSDPDGTWTFTRSTTGDSVTIDRPTALRTNFDMTKNAPYLMIIYMGQNGGYTSNEDLAWQHRKMIEHAKAEHVLVLGLSSGSAESRKDYEDIMRKEFGRYFISLREYLAHPIYDGQGTGTENIINCYGLADAGLTATPEDIAQIVVGSVPSQCLIDSVHYTEATREVIGKLIYKKCCELNIF